MLSTATSVLSSHVALLLVLVPLSMRCIAVSATASALLPSMPCHHTGRSTFTQDLDVVMVSSLSSMVARLCHTHISRADV
jgi:hypothetical protein